MMKLTAKVNIDQNLLTAKIKKGSSKAQQWLDMTVAKDTDPYVPADEKILAGTAYPDGVAEIGSGEIIYRTPYARRQYYSLPRKKKTTHPHATMRWFEASKAVNRQRWLKGVREIFGQGWRSP